MNQPPKQPQPQNKQSFGQELLHVILVLSSKVGQFIISDSFTLKVQNVLEEHLGVLNYFLKNIYSIKFWQSYMKHSLLLGLIFMLKSFIIKTTIPFELLLVLAAVCYFAMKLMNPVGDIVELSSIKSVYNNHEVKKEVINDFKNSEVERVGIRFKEEVITQEGEDKPTPTQPSINQPQFIRNEATEDMLNNIRNIHSKVKQKQDKEISKDVLSEVLKTIPQQRNKIAQNNLLSELNLRNSLEETLKPLRNIQAKMGDLDKKYDNIASEVIQ